MLSAPSTGQILNNGTVAAITTGRTVTIVCGGNRAASTHVVIDVTGHSACPVTRDAPVFRY